MAQYYLGIDLGGTNIKVGCLNEDLEVLAKQSAPTHADMGPEAVVERIGEVCERTLNEAGISQEDVIGAGIGCPGPVNLSKGLVVAAPNLPLFRNVPIEEMVGGRINKPVKMENDANAAAWGERMMGAAKGVNDMVFFTLGTGIGGGVISNGKLVHGFKDDAAELGHVILYPEGGRFCGCGQQGCVEAYASAKSTALRATEAVRAGARSSMKKVLDEKGEITCKDVFDHSVQGDKVAGMITEGTARALGILCVTMLHVTGPQKIVFAGGMIEAGDFLLDRIKHYFNEYIWPMKQETLEICFAELGGNAGIIGTASLAQEAFGSL